MLKRISKLFACVSLAMLCNFAYGQHKLKTADKYYEKLAFFSAVKLYEDLGKEKNKPTPHILRRAAECNRILDRLEKSEKWYYKLMEKQSSVTENDLMSFIQVLKKNKKYVEVDPWIDALLKKNPSNSIGLDHKQNPNYFMELAAEPDRFTITQLALDSREHEFAASYYDNKYLVFSSTRKHMKVDKESLWKHDHFIELFKINLSEAVTTESPKKFEFPRETQMHEGPATFSQDGRTMFLTRSESVTQAVDGKDETLIRYNLFESTKDANGDWGELKAFPHNSDKYSMGHAALSLDGQDMYFASDMPGSVGDYDIWVCHRVGETWSKPENLGLKINTEAKEMYPFISEAGILYFASEGHAGLGGFDVYRTIPYGESNYTLPINLGAPVNTHLDDFAFITDKHEQNGFVSSNRDESKGLDDLFAVKINTPMKTILAGKVIRELDKSPIAMAKVYLLPKGGGTDTLGPIHTMDNGRFQFNIAPDKDYELIAKKPGLMHSPIKIGEVPANTFLLINDVEMREPTYAITGTILDGTTNQPLPDVLVKVEDRIGNDIIPVLTDENGQFNYPIPSKYHQSPIDYKVNITKDGFAPIGKKLTAQLTKPKEFIINATMDRTGSSPNYNNDIVYTNTTTSRTPKNDDDDSYFADDNDDVVNNDGKPSDNKDSDDGNNYTNYDDDVDFGSNDNDVADNDDAFNLENIYFDLDKWNIREDAIDNLEHVADLMTQYPSMVIEVDGHTDARATDRYNQYLSRKRAKETEQYLIAKGIHDYRIKRKRFGETRPVNECYDGTDCDENDHQLNRRVEFRILKIGARK